MKIFSAAGFWIVGLSVAGSLAVISLAAQGPKAGSGPTANGQTTEAVVDADGNLRVPDDYRTSYQFLGTWAIAADKVPGSQQIHDVYASPGTIAAYRKDGRFPDGAVLVKEVFQTTTQSMTTGTVSHAEELKGWFVMVKDSKNAHPGNSLWGDGWGWSWFDADKPTKTTSTNFKVDCLSCHLPARATDWIYVQGYSPLKGAH
ncbi:MAG: cytochrome P460 family protein [Candidatus Acidiferrales bacterium]